MRIAALFLSLALSAVALAADVTGKWAYVAKSPDGNDVTGTLVVKGDAGKLSGTIESPHGTTDLREVEFKDSTFTCKLDYSGMVIKLSLKLDGDKLAGNFATENGDTGEFTAKRAAAPAATASASPAGLWKVVTAGPDGGEIKLELTLKLDSGKWSGHMAVPDYGMDIALTEIVVNGADVTFKVPTDNGTYSVALKVDGDKIEGTTTDAGGQKSKVSGARG